MSTDNFLSLLQQLLTMVETRKPSSIALAKSILVSVGGLGRDSNKIDARTMRMVREAEYCFEYLVECREDFIGIPGEYQNNKNKRQRLMNILMPGC